MNTKQTAVEWLVDQMFKQGYFDGNKPLSITNLDHLQHQAKEKEKQQIMQAVYDSMGTNFDPNMGRAEQYYNETYGGNDHIGEANEMV